MPRGSKNSEMPNLFIIGAGKCGTSSLHSYLDLHPEISMSDVKEPMYFLRAHLEGSARPHIASRDEYLALFRPGTRIRGEASVGYSAWPRFAGIPEAIAAECEDPRFIFLAGDPVERIPRIVAQMLSSSIDGYRVDDEALSLREQLGDLDDPRNPFIATSSYMTQIRQYLDVFPRDSILILDSDDLLERREETLSEVFEFLGVDPDFRHPGFERRANQSSALRKKSSIYRRLVGLGILRRAVYRIPRRPRQALIRAVSRPLSEPVVKPQLDPELRRELSGILGEEVEELRAFTGKRFSTWSV